MLRVTLRINAEVIQDWEVRNIGAAGDGRCAYAVREIVRGGSVGPVEAVVLHDRSDGAAMLAVRALQALDGAG